MTLSLKKFFAILHINKEEDEGQEMGFDDNSSGDYEEHYADDETPLEEKKPSAFSRFCARYGPLFAVVVVAAILGLVLPIGILSLIGAYVEPYPYTCTMEASQRIPCIDGGVNPTREQCLNVSCCYDNEAVSVNGAKAPICFHYVPSLHDYEISSIQKDESNEEIQIRLKPMDATLLAFNETALDVKFTVAAVNNDYIRIRGLVDGSASETGPTYLWDDLPPGNLSEPLYRLVYSEKDDRFTLAVVRHEDNTTLVLFDGGPLVMTKNYVEFTVHTPTTNVYGLGEGYHSRLKHSMNFETWRLFDRSGRATANGNVYYGLHPFYLCIEVGGRAHGVLLGLSQPTEVALQPGRTISFRTSGGLIELHVFLGPTPRDVIRQYTNFVGRPSLLPYWALGYHTCRAYGNTSVAEQVVAGLLGAEIPHESDCGDALLLRTQSLPTNSKTYSDLKSVGQSLSATGRKMVLYQGPLVVNGSNSAYDKTAYTDGVAEDLFIQKTKSSTYLGKGLDGSAVVYPDVFNENFAQWLAERLSSLNETLHDQGIHYDGLFVVDNTPLDTTNKTASPCPTGVALPPVSKYIMDYYKEANDTVCLTALETDATPHYVRHNLYGRNYVEAVGKSMANATGSNRPMLASLSTSSGSGLYGGHWGGEYNATWTAMNVSLVQVLEFGLYGIPFTGAPICGYRGEIQNEELCWKWMQLASMFPLAFTYYGQNEAPREPLFFEPAFQTMARDVLRLRYSLMPYFYTQFYNAHRYGDPAVRPLFYEFPDDTNVMDNDHQFMWGSGLLVVPAMNPKGAGPWAYFPRGYWYEIQTQKCVDSSNRTQYRLINSEHLPNVYIRGGSIVVMQIPGSTTAETRLNGYSIMVGLGRSVTDGSPEATGELYLDDGVTFDSPMVHVQFEATNSSLDSYPVQTDYGFDPVELAISTSVSLVTIMSVPVKPIQVIVNVAGSAPNPILDSDIFYNQLSQSLLLNVTEYGYDLKANFSLTWT